MEENSCCGTRKTHLDEEQYKKLKNRLNRIEGQLRGISNMLDENAYCPDILTQVSAVNAALTSLNKELLACHMRSCVTEDIRSGKTESIDEFVKLMQKLMK